MLSPSSINNAEPGSGVAVVVVRTSVPVSKLPRSLGVVRTKVSAPSLSAVAKHEARATSVRVEHNLQALHDDPSFRKLVAQVGVPPLE